MNIEIHRDLPMDGENFHVSVRVEDENGCVIEDVECFLRMLLRLAMEVEVEEDEQYLNN